MLTKSPKPPSPQNALKRFQFFTGPNGKGYSKEVIQKEMQRFAFTKQGREFFIKIQQQQRHQQRLHESTGLVPAVDKKQGMFQGLKNIFQK